MKEFNYYPIKVNKNRKNSPFSLIDIIKIKDFNNHLYIKKILKSLEKENNQKMNHSYRNNSCSQKKIKNNINYNINYNYTERNNKKEYSNYLNNNNSIFLGLNKNESNYDLLKNKLINNSYSTFNLCDQKNNINNPSKLSDYIIKPYKKKTIIMNPNPYKNRIRIKKIKLDLSTPEMNNYNNTYTDRTFYKTKHNIGIGDDSFIINLKKAYKDNKFAKTIKEKYEKKIELNGPLITLLKKNENYYQKHNMNLKKKHLNLSQEKKKIDGKINTRKNILRRSLTPDKLLNINYQKRLAQALILLLEKYCKIYLLKNKYFFLNILKNIGIRKIGIKNKTRNKNNSSIYSFYPSENNLDKNKVSKNTKNNNNNFFLTKYNSRKERILMYQLKNQNDSDLDNTNKSELYRNWSKLNKKKEIIDRRKKSQSQSQSKSPKKTNELKKNENQKLIYQNKKLLYNRSSRNIIKKKKIYLNQKYQNYDYKGKIVIVKKISTKDKKINIDIKYMDFMNFKKKKKFRNLKISKDCSIDLIRQVANKNLIIQRLGNKYINNKISNKYELNNKKNLGLIKEVEEKSNYEDKNHSKNSNEEIHYNYF